MYFVVYVDNKVYVMRKYLIDSLPNARKFVKKEQDFDYYERFIVNRKYNYQVGKCYKKYE